MKNYIAYVIAYFVVYLPISVGLEFFVWGDEVINGAYLLRQSASALIFALIMALFVVVYKKSRKKEKELR